MVEWDQRRPAVPLLLLPPPPPLLMHALLLVDCRQSHSSHCDYDVGR
jgi:hypothetical protein